MNLVIWIPVLVAIIAPLATYLGLRRKMSGQVSTSPAEALWKESSDLRAVLIQRIAHLEERLEDVGKRVEELLNEVITLRTEKDSLVKERDRMVELVKELKVGRDNGSA